MLSRADVLMPECASTGTGCAAAELGMLAGAERVEGCLFGNGERTGNADLVTLALNFYTQGIDPGLEFSDIGRTLEVVTQCNDMPVPPRTPYAGELVHTAFSGSHQDAIKKGFEARRTAQARAADTGASCLWCVPYLPIDPADLGTTYEAVIRVNSQSGKGGIAYLVKEHLGLDMPRKMQIAFYRVVQTVADREAREMTVEDITRAFRRTYAFGGEPYEGRLALGSFRVTSETIKDGSNGEERHQFEGTVLIEGAAHSVRGAGKSAILSLLDALKTHLAINLALCECAEHAIDQGPDVKSASYVELVEVQDQAGTTIQTQQSRWGVGVGADIVSSGLRAVLSAANAVL
jgi:2-isopropylmalate synthase